MKVTCFTFCEETYNGEFDPGSGRTLAAGLIHASRTVSNGSGARVRNTYVTYLMVGDSRGKLRIIPHVITVLHRMVMKGFIRH
jgi:hypothetical protein